MFKILLINQIWYHEDDAQIEVKEVSLAELLENPDYEIQADLERAGWKNVKKVVDRDARLALNKNFYLISGQGYPTVLPVDLDKLQSYNLTSLANGSKLVQEVSVQSALDEAQYKQYQKAKKVIDNQKRQQAEAKRKRAEKKKTRELAKAAKVLQENGIKVDLETQGG
jgi:hypothetical protein